MAAAQPGEPIILLTMDGQNNGGADFLFSGGSDLNKVYRFQWDRVKGDHVFRVPNSIWNMDNKAVCRDILDQKLLYPILVTVELPKEADEKPKKHYPKPKPDKEKEKKPEGSGLTVEILRESIAGLEKATRASALAKEMGVELSEIEALAALPDSGIEIASGGWIKLKA